VLAWGDNSMGQTKAPADLTNVIAIACGSFHSLALRADSTVTAWGNDIFGATNVPAGLTNVVAVAAGDELSVALIADGTVVVWGENKFGQTNVPPGLSGVGAIAAGGSFVLALIGDGQPFITSSPVDQTVTDGSTVWLRVAATGLAPLSYQWKSNSSNLPDATNAVLILNDVHSGQAGPYSVAVNNSVNGVESPTARSINVPWCHGDVQRQRCRPRAAELSMAVQRRKHRFGNRELLDADECPVQSSRQLRRDREQWLGIDHQFSGGAGGRRHCRVGQ